MLVINEEILYNSCINSVSPSLKERRADKWENH